jgi:hypothetical protein
MLWILRLEDVWILEDIGDKNCLENQNGGVNISDIDHFGTKEADEAGA